MPIAIMYTDGELKYSDIMTECREKQWSPVMAYKPVGQPDHSPVIPLFHDSNMDAVKRFMQRNIPRDWARGFVTLGQEEMNFMAENNWMVHLLEYPHKIVGRKEIVIYPEIIEHKTKIPFNRWDHRPGR